MTASSQVHIPHARAHTAPSILRALEDKFGFVNPGKRALVDFAMFVAAMWGEKVSRKRKHNKEKLIKWIAKREDRIRAFLPFILIVNDDGKQPESDWRFASTKSRWAGGLSW
jgi:hypothetical protein